MDNAYLMKELKRRDLMIKELMTHIEYLNDSYVKIKEMLNDKSVDLQHAPPPLEDDESDNESITSNASELVAPPNHKWSEDELKVLSQYYKSVGGVWQPDYPFYKKWAVTSDAVYAKWENCRFMDIGESYYPGASKLHQSVWKQLGYKKGTK